MVSELEKKIFVKDEIPKKPSENMAINNYFLSLVGNGTYDFIGRTYINKPGIILGKNESLNDVNLDECKKNNVEVTRRQTGGAFVYVEPEKTLCYSFFYTDSNDNIHSKMNLILENISKELGNNFQRDKYNGLVIQKNGEISLPIGGHSMHSTTYKRKVVQFDGIVTLKKLNANKINELTHLREVFDYLGEKIIRVNKKYYTFKGSPLNVDETKLKYILHEKDLIEKLPCLYDYNINSNQYSVILQKTVNNLFGPVHLSNINLDKKKYEDYYKNKIQKKDTRIKGHCFLLKLERW